MTENIPKKQDLESDISQETDNEDKNKDNKGQQTNHSKHHQDSADGNHKHGHTHLEKEIDLKTYTPLILVIGGILVVVAILEYMQGRFDLMESMRYFMGLFFLTFGIFKTLDWKGFASAYAEYDILAKHSKIYAFAYPLIELTLGAFYMFEVSMIAVNAVTAVIMGISSIGVIKAVTGEKKIRCACLGTVVKLPMTTVTIIEDVGMGLMALAMLVMILI